MSASAVAILAACEAAEAESLLAANTARRRLTTFLAAHADLHVAASNAGRQYETEPSEANHQAYCAAWQQIRALDQRREALLAARNEALAAHGAAVKTLDAIRRLRSACDEVAALGYDPTHLINGCDDVLN